MVKLLSFVGNFPNRSGPGAWEQGFTKPQAYDHHITTHTANADVTPEHFSF